MPEQLLSLIDRPAGIKDIGGESVPHLMRRRRPAQPSPPGCSGDQVIDRVQPIGAPRDPRNKFTRTKSLRAACGTRMRSNS